MKKRNIKNLNINKTVISNFKSNKLFGGTSGTVGCIGVPPFTEGDCIHTWGDEGCLTGIKYLC